MATEGSTDAFYARRRREAEGRRIEIRRRETQQSYLILSGEAEVEAEEEAAAEAEELLLGASEPMRPPLLLLLLAEGDNGTVPSIAVRSFTPRAQTDFGYLGQWEDSRWT
jgi:hypothetical protein